MVEHDDDHAFALSRRNGALRFIGSALDSGSKKMSPLASAK
jgi:hypothetical protein